MPVGAMISAGIILRLLSNGGRIEIICLLLYRLHDAVTRQSLDVKSGRDDSGLHQQFVGRLPILQGNTAERLSTVTLRQSPGTR